MTPILLSEILSETLSVDGDSDMSVVDEVVRGGGGSESVISIIIPLL